MILIYAITLSAFIATILGSDFFIVEGDFNPPYFVEHALRVIPFAIQSIFGTGFIFNRDWKFLKKPLVFYIIIDIVVGIFLPDEFVAVHAFVSPVVWIVALMIISGKYKQVAKSSLIFVLLFAPATAMGVYVRSQTFVQNEMNLQALMSLAIDVIVISIAIHYVGVGGVTCETSKKQTNKMVLPERESSEANGRQICSPQTSFVWLIRNIRHWRVDDWWRVLFRLLLNYIALLVVFGFVSLSGNVLIGFIIVVIYLLFCHYGNIPQWHNKESVLYCMGIAGAVFWAAAVISARFGMSLYMPVVVGLGVAVGFFKINNYVSMFDDNAEYRAKWETKTKLLEGFSLQIPMDENILRDVAELKFADSKHKKRDIDLLVFKYCKGWKNKKIVAHFQLNYTDYGMKHQPAYSTVSSWLYNAETTIKSFE